MAKIRITESELKQLIRESVERELNEDYASRMARRNQKYNDALANAQEFSRDFDDLSPEEQQKYGTLTQNAGYGGDARSNYNSRKQTADRQLRRATRRNGYAFQEELAKSQETVQKLSQQIQALMAANNTYKSQNEQLTKQVNQLNVAIQNAQNMIRTKDAKIRQLNQLLRQKTNNAPTTPPTTPPPTQPVSV